MPNPLKNTHFQTAIKATEKAINTAVQQQTKVNADIDLLCGKGESYFDKLMHMAMKTGELEGLILCGSAKQKAASKKSLPGIQRELKRLQNLDISKLCDKNHQLEDKITALQYELRMLINLSNNSRSLLF